MKRKLPPFAAIKAFEATARHLSFSKAAEEMGVSQAAISRQVRVLEDFLGVNLLVRSGKNNHLTNSGKLLLEEFRSSLNNIETAVNRVASDPGKTLLTVSVSPFFSSSWLTPRIMNFIEENPMVDLRLHHSYYPPNYNQDQVDIGINWGNGNWPGVVAEKFYDGSLTPVCTKDYYMRSEFTKDPSSLLKNPLLYEFEKNDWINWFIECGLKNPNIKSSSKFGDSNALKRAALDGHGIALFFDKFVEDDIDAGRLIKPFNVSIDTGNHYFLNYPKGRELTSYAKLFRTWVRSEVNLAADK